MCVGLPAKVEEIEDGIITVNASGARCKVPAAFTENIKPGDYVMIHAGTVIARITCEEAEETHKILEELYDTR